MHDSEPLLERRSLIASIGTVSVIGLAGCAGDDGDASASDGDDGDASASDDIDEVEYNDEMLVASLDEDHDVDRLEVISEDGERTHTANVGTETLVELFNVIEGSSSFDDDDTDYVGETLTVRAVDSEDELLGERDIEYAPEIQVTDLDIDFREAEIQFTVENVGEGPVGLTTNVELESVEITPVHEDMLDDEPIEFPEFELTDTDGLTSTSDDIEEILGSGESEQVSREAEPIIHDPSFGPDEDVPRPNDPNSNRYPVENQLDEEEIPLDRTEAIVGFEVGINAEPSGLDESFEGEIEFSGFTGHRDKGREVRGTYAYTIQIVADDGEIVSFEGN